MFPNRFATSVIGVALSLFGPLLFPDNSSAQSFNFVSIDVPCSACVGGVARRTSVGGISPTGDMVGAYTDAVGGAHGFLLSHGRFTTIDVPNALGTSASGINPGGDIVGSYTAPVSAAPWGSPEYCPAAGSPACIKGFLYSHGKFSTILFPGHPGAVPARITPDGSIYGCLHDFDLMGSMYGAAWTRSGDTSVAAGGGGLSDPGLSYPSSMHRGATPGGVIVGSYTDMMTGHTHGYVLRNGMLQTYDVLNSLFTIAFDINPKEDLVGSYKDTSGKVHGFLQYADGSDPITIDYPNAVSTTAGGLNPEGAIVGTYTDTKGHTHGFLAAPVTGRN
jgi:hypothetical protein